MDQNQPISDIEFEEIIKAKVAASEDRIDESVKILPWIGSSYDKAPCRVLIVGESVWCDEETRQRPPYPLQEAAIRVTEEGRWRKSRLRLDEETGKALGITGNFTGNVFWYMTGLSSEEARKRFPGGSYVKQWEQWAFWDLIQGRLEESSTLPSESEWDEGFSALTEGVKCLKPHLVLGLSCRMGDRFHKKFGADKINETTLRFEGHPSWRGMSATRCGETHRRIQEALSRTCPDYAEVVEERANVHA